MKNNFVLVAITYFYTNGKAKCSGDVLYIGKDKYPKKILMWIAISIRAMSKPYFRLSKSVAVNTDIYINKCFQPDDIS